MVPAMAQPQFSNHHYSTLEDCDDKSKIGKKNPIKGNKISSNSRSGSSGEPLSINSDYFEGDDDDRTTCCCGLFGKNKIKSDDVIGDNSVDEKSAMIKNESSAMGDNYDDKYNGDDDDDDESTCCCCFRSSKREKLSKVDHEAFKRCSSSMEGSTMSRRSRISLCGPQYYSHPGVKGMKNLGNTCYLSSMLQCLNQTVEVFKLLTDAASPQNHDQNYLILKDSSASPDRMGIKVTVDRKMGSVGKALYKFFTEINSNESRTVVKPTAVLSTIRQCNKMYQGHSQQDSHEVFRTILDCIRNEECEEIKRAIYRYFGVGKKSINRRGEVEQREINAYLRQAQKYCKLVREVFGGRVVNIIVCRECNSILALEEEYFDLSVPVAKRVEKASNCYSHSFEIPTNSKSSNYLTATEDTSKEEYEDAYDRQMPEPETIIRSTPREIPGSRSPTLSRPSTTSTAHTGMLEMSTSSRKRSNQPVASYMRTDTRQKYSMPTSEFVESNRFTDSVRSSTVVIPHMPEPSMTKSTKPADEGHSNLTTVTIENEAVHQYQPPAVVPVPSEVNNDYKVASSSSVIGGASVHNDSSSTAASTAASTATAAVVKGAKFTTDEKQLQLHLKKEKFPYRVSRCNVETDLEAGLQAYFELDVLDEHNKFMCDVCTAERVEKQGYSPEVTSQIGLSEVSKQLSIADLPEILVLHMKRFNLGVRVSKSTIIISFPLILNMAPYCTNECLEEFADSSMKILYGLYAVVEHRGNCLSGGHYVAYIRRRNKKLAESVSHPSRMVYDEDDAKKGDWFYVNDRQVKRLPGGFEDLKKQQVEVYMLFYERLPVVNP
ncbi:ubiquitin carboxyl-terminal hydrolase 45-like isoform X2 [Dysidea avara]|uniref:ubiquitin carboxyl-terminal hydrolase 45-like isoform X2 n=1 Tax=Dysidea avara TaxID=196820 RepID=UPI003320E301